MPEDSIRMWSRSEHRCKIVLFLAAIIAPAIANTSSLYAQTVFGDPNYQALRTAQPVSSFLVENLEIKRDIGNIILKSGHISFTEPVLDLVTTAVFTGEGEFTFTPTQPSEIRNLSMFTAKETVNEGFHQAVFIFTDDTYAEVKEEASSTGLDPNAAKVLENLRSELRQRRERPRSSFEAMLSGEDMDNVDADVLTDLYTPEQRGAFSAYISGQQHDDLRFHIRPRGGLPQVESVEEVALINIAPGGDQEGIWYLSNLDSEIASGTASADEDKRLIDAIHYSIDTKIEGDRDINARCLLRFRPLLTGVRVIKFGLLPNLRVLNVNLSGHGNISYIQEPTRQDGSLYVILPEGLDYEKEHELTIDYAGKRVIRSAGSGNFYVGARTSWYPSVNSFNDRATFELSFSFPKKMELVSVGDLIEEKKEGNTAHSKWASKIPLPVAGFNYGQFKKRKLTDKQTKYQVEGYATSKVPDWMQGNTLASSLPRQGAYRGELPPVKLSPDKMMRNTMSEAQVALQVFTHYFGPAPYGRIAITQQPQMNFGQSWPSLVYLPIIAFIDSTQRWMMFGQGAFNLSEFVQEVTPHEVAHQWWGHMVGWKTYHDQWLSEGFADYSAGLFLLSANKTPDKFLQFAQRWREAILEKNEYGLSPNDVGPIWMGQRLSIPRYPNASSQLIYSKGGYVLHMLRQMLFSPEKGHEAFRAMMQDYVKTYLHQNTSTADFQHIVEKHMPLGISTKQEDGGMDWFFKQWVYGTDIPSYRLEYTLEPQSGGKTLIKATVTQSGVSGDFRMPVPIYGDFNGNVVLIGRTVLTGNSTSPLFSGHPAGKTEADIAESLPRHTCR